MTLSSRGLGHCPLTATTRVRFPLGSPNFPFIFIFFDKKLDFISFLSVNFMCQSHIKGGFMMTTYTFLQDKLRSEMTILNMSFIEMAYVFMGFLIAIFYPEILSLNWAVYLITALLAASPIWMKILSIKGESVFEKIQNTLKVWTPECQVLTLISVTFFSFLLVKIYPSLAAIHWGYHAILLFVFASKPFYAMFIRK